MSLISTCKDRSRSVFVQKHREVQKSKAQVKLSKSVKNLCFDLQVLMKLSRLTVYRFTPVNRAMSTNRRQPIILRAVFTKSWITGAWTIF